MFIMLITKQNKTRYVPASSSDLRPVAPGGRITTTSAVDGPERAFFNDLRAFV
jgi:hypothetical protein